MLIVNQDRSSQISTCLAAAGHFHLDEATAIEIVASQIRAIGEHWRSLCDEAGLGEIDRALFWGRQFLNPYAFYGLEGPAAMLTELSNMYRVENG
jgi:serine/threonine-protein kinase HipA